MKQTGQAIRGLVSKTRPWSTAWNRNGLTLIEILMVMSIFSIGILAIMTLHVTAINSNNRAHAIMTGNTLLADQFEKLISAGYASIELGPEETRSRVQSGFLIEHTVFTTLIPNIKKVDLTVTQEDRSGRRLTVTYYKRNPD